MEKGWWVMGFGQTPHSSEVDVDLCALERQVAQAMPLQNPHRRMEQTLWAKESDKDANSSPGGCWTMSHCMSGKASMEMAGSAEAQSDGHVARSLSGLSCKPEVGVGVCMDWGWYRVLWFAAGSASFPILGPGWSVGGVLSPMIRALTDIRQSSLAFWHLYYRRILACVRRPASFCIAAQRNSFRSRARNMFLKDIYSTHFGLDQATPHWFVKLYFFVFQTKSWYVAVAMSAAGVPDESLQGMWAFG